MPLRAEEQVYILAVARGKDGNAQYETDRERAVAAHRRVIQESGYLQSPEGRFMSEIDNPCPDLMLRSMYRKKLLNTAGA